MKKVIAIILVLSSLFLCSCGSSPAKAANTDYASQEEFLKDMAAGITKRVSDNTNTDSMTAEQQATCFLKLVGYELDRIEKYQDLSFEDETFNQLAHLYISACQTQRFAAQQYKNSALYDSLWSAGRSTRSAIITELYSRYGLPLTSEQAASYAPATSYTISLAPSASSTEDKDYSDCLSIEVIGPKWNEHYSNADYYHYDLLVTNVSADLFLDVMISVVFYDSNGNAIGTDKEEVRALGKGETQYCELKTDTIFSSAEYKVEQAEKSYYKGYMSDLTFNVTTPNNKVLVEIKNTGNDIIEYGSANCVFYNGSLVVDVDEDVFAYNSDKIKPGESHYAELETRYTYTDFKLFYYAYSFAD